MIIILFLGKTLYYSLWDPSPEGTVNNHSLLFASSVITKCKHKYKHSEVGLGFTVNFLLDVHCRD